MTDDETVVLIDIGGYTSYIVEYTQSIHGRYNGNRDNCGYFAVKGNRAYTFIIGTGADASHIFSFDIKNAEIKWAKKDWTRVPLTITDSTVLGATGDLLFARSSSDWSEKWEFRTGVVKASPAVANGTVYVGNTDGKFYALSTTTGELEWLLPVDGAVQSAPMVADGVVDFGTDAGTVYAVDAKKGEALWTFNTGGKVQSSPAVVDGTLYIGSDNKKLYALTE